MQTARTIASSRKTVVPLGRRDRQHRAKEQTDEPDIGGTIPFVPGKRVESCLAKGQGIALLYENPLVRECGDIDFYFQTAQEGDCAFELIKGWEKR